MKVQEALQWLKSHGTQRTVDGMGRYGIPSAGAFGVTMASMKVLAKQIGKDHALAKALWESGWYEARMVATLVDDPMQVTLRQMTDWADAFDNWAICDTACFALFDKTPLAWKKAQQWAKAKPEFVKRAGFALMACLALHDKTAPEKNFLAFLPIIEKEAGDERNFVKKGISWALRSVGGRSPALNQASVAVARRLAASAADSARWVGKDALRQLAAGAARKKAARRIG